jgi:hypothetical protein
MMELQHHIYNWHFHRAGPAMNIPNFGNADRCTPPYETSAFNMFTTGNYSLQVN